MDRYQQVGGPAALEGGATARDRCITRPQCSVQPARPARPPARPPRPQFIESAAGQRPEIAAQLAELGELYHKKLWHQLTVALERDIELEGFQRGGFLVQLYQNFIAGFAHKINLLKLAVFASQVSKQIANPQVGGGEGGGGAGLQEAGRQALVGPTVGWLPGPEASFSTSSSYGRRRQGGGQCAAGDLVALRSAQSAPRACLCSPLSSRACPRTTCSGAEKGRPTALPLHRCRRRPLGL